MANRCQIFVLLIMGTGLLPAAFADSSADINDLMLDSSIGPFTISGPNHLPSPVVVAVPVIPAPEPPKPVAKQVAAKPAKKLRKADGKGDGEHSDSIFGAAKPPERKPTSRKCVKHKKVDSHLTDFSCWKAADGSRYCGQENEQEIKEEEGDCDP